MVNTPLNTCTHLWAGIDTMTGIGVFQFGWQKKRQPRRRFNPLEILGRSEAVLQLRCHMHCSEFVKSERSIKAGQFVMPQRRDGQKPLQVLKCWLADQAWLV